MDEMELTWEKATSLYDKIYNYGCRNPVPDIFNVNVTPDIKPRLNTPSTILCKIKVRGNKTPDLCSVIDRSYCPLNIPLEDLKKLAEDL
jgi:hypothetical protein